MKQFLYVLLFAAVGILALIEQSKPDSKSFHYDRSNGRFYVWFIPNYEESTR